MTGGMSNRRRLHRFVRRMSQAGRGESITAALQPFLLFLWVAAPPGPDVALGYFSPRPLCHFDLVIRAISISRRIASERVGLSFCCFAQVSIVDLSSTGSRIVRTGSRPVAGRPGRLFGVTFSVDDLAMFW
jgi:hypothetical protein